MRDFTFVRSIYLVVYGAIWCIALIMIVGALASVFTDVFAGTVMDAPVSTVLLFAAVVIATAMVFTWLVLITICLIDTRNFLAEIYSMQADKADDFARNRHPDTKYDKRV